MGVFGQNDKKKSILFLFSIIVDRSALDTKISLRFDRKKWNFATINLQSKPLNYEL